MVRQQEAGPVVGRWPRRLPQTRLRAAQLAAGFLRRRLGVVRAAGSPRAAGGALAPRLMHLGLRTPIRRCRRRAQPCHRRSLSGWAALERELAKPDLGDSGKAGFAAWSGFPPVGRALTVARQAAAVISAARKPYRADTRSLASACRGMPLAGSARVAGRSSIGDLVAPGSRLWLAAYACAALYRSGQPCYQRGNPPTGCA